MSKFAEVPITNNEKRKKGKIIVGLSLAGILAVMAPIASINSIETDAAMMNQKPYVKVIAKNALYEPSAGKTNVFGPGGIFPFFNDTFQCGDDISCGVNVKDTRFAGIFKEGGKMEDNKFWAEYTAPITYGDHQTAGHRYRIVLQDTKWNNDSAEKTPLPTRMPDFLKEGNGVAFGQIQHGHSMIDRADVPMFMNKVALYGHVNVYDITDGNKLVAENIFTHLMVGNVIDEDAYFTNMQVEPATPLVVALFAVNVPSGVQLPGGIGPLTPEQAQSFTPLADDVSLGSTPPVNYELLMKQGSMVMKPLPQSTVWPVDNPTQPVFFTFLLFSDTKAYHSANNELPK